ncbi:MULTISPECIES: GlsB/YeaQ/YmgE family stress response membrane protein [Microbulbifer]|uniref:Putative membrane protein YeaQ/YmgE (Transglycosylase-associated protein family) n=1 Tax=Microbulbifer rhizosphaerae TaxID=1562603 RepID=A0A7W4WCA3_9GAMM|nr:MULTISPECIES: GlsB/YeaQ/YmgE family stress response membrane protein [Microbulbifer]MBB3061620.1 putative membrane protein YeaQ/YmgE (transglycosylase-associated protein family) [Microbulbifer rhizosphaerae]
MGILSWIILGLIAGVLAKWIMPGPDPGGWIVTIVIGIVGAFIGGWLGSLVGIGGPVTGFALGDIVTATIGAIILLFIYRMLKRRHH